MNRWSFFIKNRTTWNSLNILIKKVIIAFLCCLAEFPAEKPKKLKFFWIYCEILLNTPAGLGIKVDYIA